MFEFCDDDDDEEPEEPNQTQILLFFKKLILLFIKKIKPNRIDYCLILLFNKKNLLKKWEKNFYQIKLNNMFGNWENERK